MSGPKVPPPPPPTPQKLPSDAVISEFLAIQKRDIEVRAQEAQVQKDRNAIEKLNAENAHAYAMKALDAQVGDLKDERQHRTKSQGKVTNLVGLVVIGVFAVVGGALYLGKDALLVEMVKAVAFMFGGGGIGYAIGARKRQDATGISDSEDDQ